MLPFRRFPLSRLLPSWWMAPWFLMLLGFCSSLFPEFEVRSSTGIQWPIQLGGSCDGGMLRLTLFPFHPKATEQKLIGLPYKTSAELDAFRRWHDISFSGTPIADFMAFGSTIQILKTIQADTSHDGGIRIRFHRHATYSSLVAILDAMGIFNQKRYWLDIRREPLTLYVITNRGKYKQEELLIL